MCSGERNGFWKHDNEEFKKEAVRLATTPGNSMASVARDLGVNRSLIGHWVRNARAGSFEAAPGVPLETDLQTVSCTENWPRSRWSATS